jgi:hypothetical protein
MQHRSACLLAAFAAFGNVDHKGSRIDFVTFSTF